MHRLLVLALLFLSLTASAKAAFPKKLLTVKLKDAAPSAFFRVVAEKIDSNLVVSDCVDRKRITVELRNVKIEDVIRLVVLQYQLDVTYDGATLDVNCAAS